MADTAMAGRTEQSARNLALINYGLLFASVFFAGVPALVAVIVAYAQRERAPPLIRSHHDFQISIFWVALATTLIAAASILGVVMGLMGELFEMSRAQGWSRWDDVTIELGSFSLGAGMVMMMAAAALFSAITWLWLIFAPAYGAIRLASARGMGHSPGP